MSAFEAIASLIALSALWVWLNLKAGETWLKRLSIGAATGCAVTATVFVLIAVWGEVM